MMNIIVKIVPQNERNKVMSETETPKWREKIIIGSRGEIDDPNAYDQAEYRLKSTVDAEREADSKTIAELAAALGALADDMDIMAYNYAERHFVAKRKDPIASRFYDAIDSFLESWCEFRWGINWSAGDSTPRPDKAYERLKKNNVNPDYKNVGETALTTHKERIDESQEDKR